MFSEILLGSLKLVECPHRNAKEQSAELELLQRWGSGLWTASCIPACCPWVNVRSFLQCMDVNPKYPIDYPIVFHTIQSSPTTMPTRLVVSTQLNKYLSLGYPFGPPRVHSLEKNAKSKLCSRAPAFQHKKKTLIC